MIVSVHRSMLFRKALPEDTPPSPFSKDEHSQD